MKVEFQKKEGKLFPLYRLPRPVAHVAPRSFGLTELGKLIGERAVEVRDELGAAENVHAARDVENGSINRHSNPPRERAPLPSPPSSMV